MKSQLLVSCVVCVASVESVRSKERLEEQDSLLWPREKNGNGGRGRGRKEMLADKPLDSENLHSPANTVPDWLG